MKDNPTSALDTLLTSDKTAGKYKVHPLCIGRYALLELLESPFVTKGQEFNVANLIPSFFVMTADYKDLIGYNSKNVEDLRKQAMLWAENLTMEDTAPLMQAIFEDLGLLKTVAPEATQDTKSKKEEA